MPVLLLALLAASPAPSPLHEDLPPGFQETTVLTGLDKPTAVRFAPDGHVLVAEKSGIVKIWHDLDAPTPTILADLSSLVYSGYDRGLLGLAIDPDWPAEPYVYVLYTYDAPLGQDAPVWNDVCLSPDGCEVSGRLSRLTVAGHVMVGAEQVLIHDWCQQFPTHSVGDLHFGPDGALYATAGEAASFSYTDYGQQGNPCDDPPLEGGALRVQDVRTTGDPVGLHGALIRIDPATGQALPDNPLYGGAVGDDDRIVAFGLRNPFRFAIHPDDGRIFIADTGWNGWEEINLVADPTDAVVENFGWPCYEGPERQPDYDAADLPLCESLYASGEAVPPFYAYSRGFSAGIAGIAVYAGGSYPAQYEGALFFADYAARWIKVMTTDLFGNLDPGSIVTFRDDVTPVDLTLGPGGDLFYVDHAAGAVRRIEYFSNNQPPQARLVANGTSGPAPAVVWGPSPLAVQFDGTGSSDPDGDPLVFAWDLDGDGDHDDSTLESPLITYRAPGILTVGLRVTDSDGVSRSDTILISVDNAPPDATILAPTSTVEWRVGDTLAFSGAGTDPETGDLPAEALSWNLVLHHCWFDDPTDCHEHGVAEWSGVEAGEFIAVDHDPITFLELRLTVREPASGALALEDTTSVVLVPETSSVTLATEPPGLELALYGTSDEAPFTMDAMVGSLATVSAPELQTLGLTTWVFESWSDGGDASHEITVPETDLALTATYAETTCPARALASTSSGSGRAPPRWLGGLYRLRDDVLPRTSRGRRWTRLYDRHAPAVTRILAERPALRRRALALLITLTPALEELAASAGDELDTPPGRRVPPHAVALLESVLLELEQADAEGKLARDLRSEREALGLEGLAGRTVAEAWERIQRAAPEPSDR